MAAFRYGVGAYAAVFGIGYLGYMLMPALLVAASDAYGLSELQVGLSATVQLSALAVSLFYAAPRLARLGGRRVALVSSLIATAGLVLTACAPSFEVYLAGLAISGLGMGGAIAGGDAFVAASSSPRQLFAVIFAAGQATAILLLLLVMPGMMDRWGVSGGYGVVAGIALLMTLLIMIAPSVRDGHPKSGGEPSWRVYLAAPVIAMLMLGAADAAVWPFTALIATELQFEAGGAETIVAAALGAGVVGAACAALFAGPGRGVWFYVAVAALALFYCGVLSATTPSIYAVSQILALFMFGFVTPNIIGLSGELDRTGGMMAAAAGAQMVGLAASPWLAGFTIEAVGRSTLGLIVAGIALLIIPLMMAGRRMQETGNGK